jgi:hypothetical protein
VSEGPENSISRFLWVQDINNIKHVGSSWTFNSPLQNWSGMQKICKLEPVLINAFFCKSCNREAPVVRNCEIKLIPLIP